MATFRERVGSLTAAIATHLGDLSVHIQEAFEN